MESVQKMTAQGVRDLNHQGPRKKPEPAVIAEGAAPVDGAVDPLLAAVVPATETVAVATPTAVDHG